MDYKKTFKLKDKLYFTADDVASAFNIKLQSAYVVCSRYVKRGLFIRLKKNFYILPQAWDNFSNRDFYQLANFLQVPSYISFMSALTAYNISTQVTRGFYESAALKRSVKFKEKAITFNYYKMKRKYYFKFKKKDNFFIATKEKALVDTVYLYSFGKYKIDFSSLNIDTLDKKEISDIIKVFPKKTQNTVKKLCRI
jgi:predicted transcriptional regulator of viral defense system